MEDKETEILDGIHKSFMQIASTYHIQAAMTDNTETTELFLAAKQLGVEPKEASKLMRAIRILSNSIVSAIVGITIGIVLGAFFPRTTTYTYPYTQSQAILGIGATQAHQKSFLRLTILYLILGIIGFIVGFVVSSQIIFANYTVTFYGVYSRKNH